MEINEAIAHCRDVEKTACAECALEHEQLRIWLEELTEYRALGTPSELLEKLERLKQFEADEKAGLIVRNVCNVGDTIDKLYSHNEIIALWYKVPESKHTSRRLWKGMAWETPKEYRSLRFIRIFGTVPEFISDGDTINILVEFTLKQHYKRMVQHE